MSSSEKNTGSNSSKDEKSDQLYRVIPVEEDQAYKYGRVHFWDMLQFYWAKRKIVYWSVGIFLVIGLIFAFFSKVEYQADTSVIPEYELQDKINEVIESFGLIFGLTGNFGGRTPPSDLMKRYPYMINSISFQKKLMYNPFYYAAVDSTITMYTYFTQIYSPSPLQTIYRYTLGLPSTLEAGFNSGTDAQFSGKTAPQDSLFRIIYLSPKEQKVIHQLESRISANYQRRKGVVRIQTTMPDPVLAAKLAQLTLKELQQTVSKYKTEKTRLYKNFLGQQLEQARADLAKTRENLTDFKNAGNQPLNQRLALQSRYNFMLDRYNTINQLYSRIKLTIEEQIPVFRILDNITIPDHRSAPNRKLIIILSLLLGFLVAVCWITISFFVSTLRGKSPYKK